MSHDPESARDLFTSQRLESLEFMVGQCTVQALRDSVVVDMDSTLSLAEVYGAHIALYMHGATASEEAAVLAQLDSPTAQHENVERLLYAVRARNAPQPSRAGRRRLWSRLGTMGVARTK